MQPALFEYRISGHPAPLLPGDPLLQHYLPANRHADAATGEEIQVNLATYFSAITDFLTPRLTNFDRDFNTPIRIVMEKHGAFYHPASVHLTQNGIRRPCYAVNVAVSQQGRRIMAPEFAALFNLQQQFAHTPRAIAMETVNTGPAAPVSMLMTEWLSDYHEFHLTDHPDGPAIVVWTPDGDRIITDSGLRTDIYRQTARILTDYYNPETGSQISPWHHAAGDFVINLTNEPPDIKLITIRQYSPMFDPPPGPDLISQLEGIWFFLVQMSVRMRLDRTDGIGDIVWADATAVKGTVDGWFRALKACPAHEASGMALSDLILPYIDTKTDEDWKSAAADLLQSTPAAAPEYSVIHKNLIDHIDRLRSELTRMPPLV